MSKKYHQKECRVYSQWEKNCDPGSSEDGEIGRDGDSGVLKCKPRILAWRIGT